MPRGQRRDASSDSSCSDDSGADVLHFDRYEDADLQAGLLDR
jgi:hypothetical protein